MMCEKCQQRSATVHMTKLEGGNKTETNLCEVCAREEGPINFGIEPNLMLQNIFAELFNQALAGSQQFNVSVKTPVPCQQCGFTDTRFSQVGKLGCPKCYEVFENKLEPVLRRVHGNIIHNGKIPKRTGAVFELRKEILGLKQQLKDAVVREEYEKAAEIRDRIRETEKHLEL
jgi:protein arginine kinase activator